MCFGALTPIYFLVKSCLFFSGWYICRWVNLTNFSDLVKTEDLSKDMWVIVNDKIG